MRIAIGCLAVSLIVYLLASIPYDILREERYRLYGESRTTGVVTAVQTVPDTDGSSRYVIAYKFADGEGFVRQDEAPVPRTLWEKFQPGSRVMVLFVRSRPHMARIEGEIEPGFQVWLRKILN